MRIPLCPDECLLAKQGLMPGYASLFLAGRLLYFLAVSPLPFPDSLRQTSRMCKDDLCVSTDAIVT